MSKQARTRLTTSFLLLVVLLLTLPAREAPARQTGAGTKTLPAKLAKPDAAAQARLSAAYSQLPLSFEANQGQTDSRTALPSSVKSKAFATPPHHRSGLHNDQCFHSDCGYWIAGKQYK
jgi:hypothetical protein